MKTIKDQQPETNSYSQTTGIVKAVWKNPVGKFSFIAAGSVVGLFAMGWLFRLLAWVRVGYRQYQESGVKALPASPVK